MKLLAQICFVLCFILGCVYPSKIADKNRFPSSLIGHFEDDYRYKYTINDSMFSLLPDNNYHILKCNASEEYLIVRNDSLNPYARDLFSRIDYLILSKIDRYAWAFCFSSFEAKKPNRAKKPKTIDKLNPK